MEVDMLLSDLPPVDAPRPKLSVPSSLTAYRVPVSGGVNKINYLQQQEEALEGQVTDLTHKREQLAGELEGLISQVCHMMQRPHPLPEQRASAVGTDHFQILATRKVNTCTGHIKGRSFDVACTRDRFLLFQMQESGKPQ
jgi:hypothetical protein